MTEKKKTKEEEQVVDMLEDPFGVDLVEPEVLSPEEQAVIETRDKLLREEAERLEKYRKEVLEDFEHLRAQDETARQRYYSDWVPVKKHAKGKKDKPIPKDASLYELILEYFRNLRLMWVDDVFAFFACSVGSLIAAKANKPVEPMIDSKGHFAPDFGGIADLRLHIFMIAPKGTGKDVAMNSYLSSSWGVVGGLIPSDMKTFFTEAYLSGTSGEFKRGGISTKVPIPGAAEALKEGILAVSEFSSVEASSKQQHSTAIYNTILSIMSEGKVSKGLASADLNYLTNVVCWFGTQPARAHINDYIDMGLDRRACFINLSPTREDLEEMKHRFWEGQKQWHEPSWIDKIRLGLKELMDDFELDDVVYSNEFRSFVDKIVEDRPHEQRSYCNLAVGYHVMHKWKKGMTTLNIDIDNELRRLIELEAAYRRQLFHGEDANVLSSIIALVAETEKEEDRKWHKLAERTWSKHGVRNPDFKKHVKHLVDIGELRIREVRFKKKGRAAKVLSLVK